LTKPLVLADLARELGRLLGGPPAGTPGTAGNAGNSDPGTSEVPILDEERIDQLISELGADTLRNVARAFVAEVPRRVGELRRMAAAGDADAVRRCAHSLRSPGAMIGAAALAKQLRDIEDSADPVASLSETPLDDVITATVARLQATLGQVVDEGAAP
jgi:HPt (histidine-containing phosphotransfer) domain-containing protein